MLCYTTFAGHVILEVEETIYALIISNELFPVAVALQRVSRRISNES